MKNTTLIFVFLGLCIAGCSDLNRPSEELEDKIKILAQIIKQNNEKIEGLKIDSILQNRDSIPLDLSERVFNSVDTNVGSFMVKVKDVKPYLNGFKVFISIGNPYSAEFSDIKVLVKHGKKIDVENFDNWNKLLKEKEFSISKDLKAGYWNDIELIFNDTKSDELGYFEFSMETSGIKFYTDK